MLRLSERIKDLQTINTKKSRKVRVLGASTISGLQLLINKIRNKIELTFSEKLIELINEKGKKPAEIYKKADITKEVFSKIKRNKYYHPTKDTALAFSIALHLSIKETTDLIGRAGYALSNSMQRDLVVQYFIESKNYNMHNINCKLIEYGFEPLTNKHNAYIKE